jgi:hypothetical protein
VKSFLADTDAQRRLLTIMSGLRFGRIEGLVVRNGEAVFDPSPRITREFKFGTADEGRFPADAIHSEVKKQVRQFFDAVAQIGDGVIASLEFRHGLPFRMSVVLPPGGDAGWS